MCVCERGVLCLGDPMYDCWPDSIQIVDRCDRHIHTHHAKASCVLPHLQERQPDSRAGQGGGGRAGVLLPAHGSPGWNVPQAGGEADHHQLSQSRAGPSVLSRADKTCRCLFK